MGSGVKIYLDSKNIQQKLYNRFDCDSQMRYDFVEWVKLNLLENMKSIT